MKQKFKLNILLKREREREREVVDERILKIYFIYFYNKWNLKSYTRERRKLIIII
jgi:hypothetical protein